MPRHRARRKITFVQDRKRFEVFYPISQIAANPAKSRIIFNQNPGRIRVAANRYGDISQHQTPDRYIRFSWPAAHINVELENLANRWGDCWQWIRLSIQCHACKQHDDQ